MPKVGFDTLHDLAPVTRLANVPAIILATPDFPARNLTELITLARGSPEPLAYGTPGVGSTGHVIAELLCQRTGIKLLHIRTRAVRNRIPTSSRGGFRYCSHWSLGCSRRWRRAS
jgi:tripartite-type tricarboxylate transporter receptor subunit TctC